VDPSRAATEPVVLRPVGRREGFAVPRPRLRDDAGILGVEVTGRGLEEQDQPPDSTDQSFMLLSYLPLFAGDA
jgi:hypothetical protein